MFCAISQQLHHCLATMSHFYSLICGSRILHFPMGSVAELTSTDELQHPITVRTGNMALFKRIDRDTRYEP